MCYVDPKRVKKEGELLDEDMVCENYGYNVWTGCVV